MTDHMIIIATDKCIGCGLCARTCAAHNIQITNGKADTLINDCVMCGQCSYNGGNHGKRM